MCLRLGRIVRNQLSVSTIPLDQQNITDSNAEGEAPNPQHEEDPDRKYGALVAVKSLIKFLTCHMFSNSTIACESPRFPEEHLLMPVG